MSEALLQDDPFTSLNPLNRGLGEAGGETVVAVPVGTSIAEAEKRLILATLARHGGNKRQAARVLGVSVRTIYNRLRAWRITDAF